jgi:predicted branched-subunit amino acid permease
MANRTQAFLAGARAVAPILLGVVPFALVTGAATVGIGIPPVSAIGMSLLVFAGTSQLATVELLGAQAPALVIIATALIVNLRFSMYSASIAPYFAKLPGRWKGPFAYLLTDQAYAVSVTRFERDVPDRARLSFYLGAACGLWVTWQVAFALGAASGGRVSESWSLDFAVPLTLLALLPASVGDRAAFTTVVATAAASALVAGLPLNLGVIVAVGIGVAAGALSERVSS